MFLDRNITVNIYNNAICFNFYKIINGILKCVFKKLWLINYLSIIKTIFDIVSRAVNALLDNIPIPQLEQINNTIKHNKISLFDYVSKARNVTIAVNSQNANFAVCFLLCKKRECEVANAK